MFDIPNLKRMFVESLNINGRITRVDHFLRKLFLVFLLIFVAIIAMLIINFVAKTLGEPAKMGSSVVIDFFFIIVFLIYAYIFGVLWNVITVLRLHDLNLDGRWCALNFVIFIPMLLMLFRISLPKPGEFPLSYTLPVVIFVLFNLAVLFLKGDENTNKYGAVPWDPANRIITEQERLAASPEAAQNAYIASYGTLNRKNKSKIEPGHGIARKVDKKIIKHNSRYQPKSGKKK